MNCERFHWAMAIALNSSLPDDPLDRGGYTSLLLKDLERPVLAFQFFNMLKVATESSPFLTPAQAEETARSALQVLRQSREGTGPKGLEVLASFSTEGTASAPTSDRAPDAQQGATWAQRGGAACAHR